MNNPRPGQHETDNLDGSEMSPNQRLRYARKAAGYKTATEAARSIGISSVTYTAHENGGRNLNAEAAGRYAPHLGVKPEWLLYGSDNPEDSQPEDNSGSSSTSISQLTVRHYNSQVGDFCLDKVEEEFDLPEQFLRSRLRIKERGARIMEVKGDYMYDPANPAAAGSLLPGDRVIIDVGDCRPSPPGAFAIFDGAGVSLKLVEVVPNSDPMKLRLTGRNPRYSHFEQLHDEVAIIGRVKAKVSML